MPLRHTAGEITVVESPGRVPVLYLVGPPAPPFEGLPGNGPVLATIAQSNPNAAGDAKLWAKAGDLREVLAELVDCQTRGCRVGECSTTARAVKLLEELDG
jgi:hypothetical protein